MNQAWNTQKPRLRSVPRRLADPKGAYEIEMAQKCYELRAKGMAWNKIAETLKLVPTTPLGKPDLRARMLATRHHRRNKHLPWPIEVRKSKAHQRPATAAPKVPQPDPPRTSGKQTYELRVQGKSFKQIAEMFGLPDPGIKGAASVRARAKNYAILQKLPWPVR